MFRELCLNYYIYHPRGKRGKIKQIVRYSDNGGRGTICFNRMSIKVPKELIGEKISILLKVVD